MKKQSPHKKREHQQEQQLNQSCFEKAQQVLGFDSIHDTETIIAEAKKIKKFIKGK